MAVKVIQSKKQKKKETIIFVVLCIIILLLLGGNVWAVVNLVNNNKPHGSPSFVSDNESVIGYVLKGNQVTENVLTFDEEILNPGSITESKIRLENLGRKDLYLRISCDFEVSIDGGSTYEKKDFVHLIVTDSANWIKSEVDGKSYFLNKVPGREHVDTDIVLEIKQELSQEDLYEEYRNSLYKIYIKVETISADGVTLVETPEKIHEAWSK